jgi:hypothetical protein
MLKSNERQLSENMTNENAKILWHPAFLFLRASTHRGISVNFEISRDASHTTSPNLDNNDCVSSAVKMKLNISHPSNGSQKLIEVEDERKLNIFMEKRVCFFSPHGSLWSWEPRKA